MVLSAFSSLQATASGFVSYTVEESLLDKHSAIIKYAKNRAFQFGLFLFYASDLLLRTLAVCILGSAFGSMAWLGAAMAVILNILGTEITATGNKMQIDIYVLALLVVVPLSVFKRELPSELLVWEALIGTALSVGFSVAGLTMYDREADPPNPAADPLFVQGMATAIAAAATIKLTAFFSCILPSKSNDGRAAVLGVQLAEGAIGAIVVAGNMFEQ